MRWFVLGANGRGLDESMHVLLQWPSRTVEGEKLMFFEKQDNKRA